MINRVIMVGRVGKSSVVMKTDNSRTLRFSLALDNSYKKADGTWVKSTCWVNITKFRASEKQQQIEKGDLVMVEGHLTSSTEGRLFVNPDRIFVLQKKNPIPDTATMLDPFGEATEIPAEPDFNPSFAEVESHNIVTSDRWGGRPIDGDNIDEELPF